MLIISLMFVLNGCSLTSSTIKSNAFPEVKGENLSRWQALIGKWHGKIGIKGGGVHEWFVTRFSNGTYRIDFIHHRKDGSIKERTEIGDWGNSGNIYFTIYRGELKNDRLYPSDSSDPINYDAYVIDALKENEFTYTHARTKDNFTVKRIESVKCANNSCI